MPKAKNILKSAFSFLSKEDSAKLEKVRDVLSETVVKTVRDVVGEELSKVVGLGKAMEALTPKGGESTAAAPADAPAAPAVTFKDILADVDKDKLKAFLAGLDKEKVKAYIDAADKEVLKLLVDSADVDALIRYVDELEGGGKQEQAPAGESTDAALPDLPALDWCYGGLNGSKAKVSDDAVLAGATLKGDTLTFTWAKGDCRDIGATSKTDSDHTVACLFLANGKGGKFEWISTSRKTRSVGNIKDGYNGWPKTALDKGGKLYFCIAGVKDDQKTSNGLRTALVEVARS